MACVSSTEDKPRSAMLDLDFLDCPICFVPFTIPIFQCDNGHLACSSCFPKLRKKCPSCALPIGHSRCRVMEKVFESIFVPCRNVKFGCTKKAIINRKVSTHEKECIFSPCSCPVQDCNYTASYKKIYRHFVVDHKRIYSSFSCDSTFTVRMDMSDKILNIREYRKQILFAVQCFRKPYGVYVTVSFIAPSAAEVGRFSYHLSYTMDEHTVSYESPEVKRIQEVKFQIPQENYMFIPESLLRGETLVMRLCVKPRVRMLG